MTTAIKKTPNDDHQYTFVVDANTTDHPISDWAHDPDISAVGDEPRMYWKWNGSAVVEMTQAEKDIVDDSSIGPIPVAELTSINVKNFPKSDLAGAPIAVHASYKPEIPDQTTYAIWSGAGDDLSDPVNGNGNGPMLAFAAKVGVPFERIDVEFNKAYGRVWLHEAYIKFTGAGAGDYITSNIRSYPVPLQQMAYLDLVVDDDRWIRYSPMGPGTGTHGFADPNKITLVDRNFSKDGDWDFNTSGVGPALIPNMSRTGRFKMSMQEEIVHRYVNKVPCFGDCGTYFSMSSDETTELLPGYFASVEVFNNSNTEWNLSCLMELYRTMTYSP